MAKNTLLANRFELKKKLGNTVFGEVWLANDNQASANVALKLVSNTQFNKKGDTKKLREEFKVLSQIKCRHIAELLELFEERGVLFYTAEYVEGFSLPRLKGEPLSKLIPIFSDVARAMLELHNYGIVHGAIKPEDIVIRSDGSAKLVNIGLMSVFEHKLVKADETFIYTAPEIINRKKFDWRADLYSLGVIMYEALYSKLPWEKPPFSDEMNVEAEIKINFPKQSSSEMNKIIRKLLSVDPENRFGDTIELLSALERIKTGISGKGEKQTDHKNYLEVNEAEFVSRRVEMTSLLEMLDNFEATALDHAVIIESPRGAGRTRFLREFEKRIAHRNLRSLFFSASQTQNLAADIINTIWEYLDREYRLQLSLKWGGAILLYFPHFSEFGEFKNLKPVKNLPQLSEDFYRFVSMFRDFIRMGTRNSPLVLMLDNFDHIDKRSLKLIQELSSGVESSNRIFVVVTIDSTSGSNLEIPAFSRITLSPFTFSETRDYIESCLNLSGNFIDNELFLWVYRNSKGLAKQIRSLLFLLIEERLIVPKNGQIIFEGSTLAEKGVEYLLETKINSFSRKEQIVLKACSIYKKFVTKKALIFLVKDEMTEDELDSALGVLQANYLVVIYKNGKINIVNRLFQPIIYSLLTSDEKSFLHATMGDFLILNSIENLSMNINPYAFAAYHFNKAGQNEKALKLYLQSVCGLMAYLNSELAESSIDEALSIIEAHPEIMKGKKLYAVYLFAGRSYFRLGIYKKATEPLEKSYSIWKNDTILEDLVFSLAGDSDPKKAAKFIAGYDADTPDKKAVKHYLRAYVYLSAENNYIKADFHLKRALKYVQDGHDKLFGPIRRFTLKQLHFDLSLYRENADFARLEVLRNELVESSMKIDSRAFYIDALNASFVYYWNFNEMKKAYSVLHETLKLSLEIFDNYRITRSYLNLANCSHRIGRLNDVRFYLDKAVEYARKGSGANILKLCYCNYGELAIIKGEFSLADNYLYNAEEISKREFKDPELIAIYSLQVILSLLKNETGIARNIGGRLRRYYEQFETVNPQKSVSIASSLMLLEALTGNEKEVFFELDKKLLSLLNRFPLFKQTNYLFYITCKIIFYKKQGNRDSAMNLIMEVEKMDIKSSHSLFQMLYYYHAALFLKDSAPSSSLLRKYLQAGIKFSLQIQANHFYSLFNGISYVLERDDTENVFAKIRDILKFTNCNEESKTLVETEVSKLQTHIYNTKNQIEHLNTMNASFFAIIDIVKSIAGRTDFNRITEIIVKKTIDILSLEVCGIVFVGNEKEENSYLILDSSHREHKMSEFRFKAGVVPRMLKTGRIDFISGASSDKGSEFRSVAAVPVLMRGEIKAYCYLERDSTLGHFTEAEIRFLEILSENISVIYDNAELVQIATTDSLTKLYTRRHFFDILANEVEKAGRYKFITSMIMLDIDHFKEVNDTYGHLAGDIILRKLGELLKRTVRSSDYVGRFGGEEFIVLLTGTDLDGAYQTAEKIRKNCEKEEVSGVSFTVSLGVASYHEDRVKNEKDFIEKCDMALYRAKGLGRNRTVKYCDLIRRG